MRGNTKNDVYPFCYPVRMRLLAAAGFLIATACLAYVVWAFGFSAESDGIGRFKLWILAPPALVLIAGGFILWAEYLLPALKSFRVDDEGLHVRGLLGRRMLPWSAIEQFELLPGVFPRPPHELILHPDDGAPVAIASSINRFDVFCQRVAEHLPMLAAHGADRVRLLPEEARRRDRSDDHFERLFVLAAAPFLLVLTVGCVWLCYDAVRDYVNYRKIAERGVEAEGLIDDIDIDKGDDGRKVHVVGVSFTTPDGDTIQTRRQVFVALADEKQVGDAVTVQYLPEAPDINRIKDYDNDSRRPLMLILFIPGAWFLALGSVAWLKDFAQKTDTIVVGFAGDRDDDVWMMAVSDLGFESAWRLAPDRHREVALVILSAKRIRGEKHSLKHLADELNQHDIAAECIAESAVLVPPAGLTTIIDRLGQTDTVKWRYLLLDEPDPAELRQRVLAFIREDEDADAQVAANANSAADAPATSLDDSPDDARREYAYTGDVAGPFNQAELRAAFNESVRMKIESLHHGDPPSGAADADFVTLLGVGDVEDVTASIGLRKRGERIDLWCVRDKARTAQRLRFDGHRWGALADTRPPRFMRGGFAGFITLAALAPILLPFWLLIKPFEVGWNRYERRRRRRLVREAAAAQDEASATA